MVRTRLTVLILLLVASQLVASGFLLWTIENARYLIKRRDISYQQVEAYIATADASRNHIQLVHDAANGGYEKGMLTKSLDNLRANVDHLADVTDRERKMLRASELDEVAPDAERIQNIRSTVDEIVKETVLFRQRVENGPLTGNSIPPLDRLNRLVGYSMFTIITDAVAQERLEAKGADQKAGLLLSRLIWLAGGVTALGILLGAFGLYFLSRRIREPMRRLMTGVGEFTRGHLGHRTALAGQDEFAQLGQALDAMAGQLEAQRGELLEARNSLADTVAARTAELADANQRLRQTDALRQEFMANISHELRTPITVIRGEADVTLRGGPKSAAEYRDALSHIVGQAGRLTKLVDDLLLIARAGAGALTLNRDAVALKSLLLEARSHAVVLAGSDGAIEIEGDAELMAEADSDRLMQLFMILLDNAVRYSGPKPSVHIGIEDAGDGIRISVADQGPGIADEDIAHVFERFYRGRNGRATRSEGTGLGLNIAKAIVDAHDGEIGIESGPDGTIVYVVLPKAEGMRASA